MGTTGNMDKKDFHGFLRQIREKPFCPLNPWFQNPWFYYCAIILLL